MEPVAFQAAIEAVGKISETYNHNQLFPHISEIFKLVNEKQANNRETAVKSHFCFFERSKGFAQFSFLSTISTIERYKNMVDEIHVTLKEYGFDVVDFIDSGAYGLIFTVKWAQYPDQLFAAKVMYMQEMQIEAKSQAFNAEINALQILAHPNVIYVFKHFKVGKYYYIILEYCSNGSFSKFITKNGPLSAIQFRDIANQCLLAINECHQNGIVHLDIKPANILISDHNRVKLCDFGLAELVGETELIHQGRCSLSYCAPERLSSELFDPKKADIWSLGVTFYYFMVGRMPWTFTTREEAKEKIQNDEIKIPCGINEDICKIILSMLNHDAKTRPSAAELLELEYFKSINNDQNRNRKLSRSSRYNSFSSHATLILHHGRSMTRSPSCKSNNFLPKKGVLHSQLRKVGLS